MRWAQKRLGAMTAILVTIVIYLTYRRRLSNVSDHTLHFTGVTNRISSTTVDLSFLKRPIWSYDEAVAISSKSCHTNGVNIDAGSVKENEQTWKEIPSSQISRWREGIAAYLSSRAKEQEGTGPPPSPINSRGIVMAVGDHNAAIRARTNIRLLRSYNCTFPIEIFHFPNELSGSDKELLLELSQPGSSGVQEITDMRVTLRVVKEITKSNGWKDFQIKAPAIQQSSFDEILYLDTDSYLLRNPALLFESKHWQQTGLLLWPDFTKSHATNPLWRILGQGCRDEYEGESGQIVVSRALHQDVLWVAEYFALHHEDFYSFMGGDRDSFRAAALLMRKTWAGPGRMLAAAGIVLPDHPHGGGHTMLQAAPDGDWMFVHANLIKHGYFSRPLWARIHRAAHDKYDGSSTYGSIKPPNEKLGDGVKVHVDQAPRLETSMQTFEGYDEALVFEEDWDSYEVLKGFEQKWSAYGGVH